MCVQLRDVVDPVALEDVCAAQLTQFAAPDEAWYCPASHAMHWFEFVAAVVGRALPAAQNVQLACPTLL